MMSSGWEHSDGGVQQPVSRLPWLSRLSHWLRTGGDGGDDDDEDADDDDYDDNDEDVAALLSTVWPFSLITDWKW